jgi:hypothetical protein
LLLKVKEIIDGKFFYFNIYPCPFKWNSLEIWFRNSNEKTQKFGTFQIPVILGGKFL